jgi:hypothetical protein
MKIMAKDSASVRQQAPHLPQIPYGDQPSRTNTIVSALTQRAQAVLNDKSIDPQSRAIIRYALETHDPWLARLVRHVNAGKTIRVGVGESLTEALARPQTSDRKTDDSDEKSAALVRERMATLEREKIEALAEIICGGGEEAAGALLVLSSKLESSTDPKALANAAKHFAFTRCGELNLYGMVEAQIDVVEGELLT